MNEVTEWSDVDVTSRVEMLDAPLGAVVNSIMQWGLGSEEILPKKERN